jgi:hypothetical protein
LHPSRAGALRYATTRPRAPRDITSHGAPPCPGCGEPLIPPGFGLAAPGYFWQERRCDRRSCRKWHLFIYRIEGGPDFAQHLVGVQPFDRREGVVGVARALVLAGVPQDAARVLADAHAAQVRSSF